MDHIDLGAATTTLAIAIERIGENPRAVRLECSRVSVTIAKKTIVADLSCQFEGGQYVHISGPNGSGKSTFLGVLSGLLRPSGGSCRLTIGGRDLDPSTELIYVPQYPLIFYGMSVMENLALVSRRPLREIGQALHDLDRKDRPRTVSLIEKFHGATSRLSTGQQRALLIVAASLSRAPVVLMDEPYAGLSEEIARECKEEARGWARAGKLVIVVEPV
ncbi:MAG: putative transport system ATP-binding protein [Bradyrhizobium sp.]|jgi:ABC-type multidrug transport system ATPase subunit|nr:putative transport system ATP-binding protein [Bradyrhizobium sp.]